MELRERNGGYAIDLAGCELNIVYADGYSVTLSIARLAGEGGETAELRIECEFFVDSMRLDPEEPTEMPSLLALLREPVQMAEVAQDGELSIAFNTRTLRVPPSSRFEAWQMTTPSFMAVCTPGGSVAVWGQVNSAAE